MRIILLIPVLLLALSAASCSTLYPQEPVPAPMGGSVRAAVASQTLDPSPAEPTPVTGLDGQKADAVMKNFRMVNKTPLVQSNNSQGSFSVKVSR
ncbi:hypothetical protein dsx2_1891 [Desulfovibrio sp. X2]|uniref:hypothetical protein n=1 Tax=Desulfovibrio sp. X2 TaxID=941449 RepID=UPI000358D985|nr:hypothetical protein [Desulfovibrio sp. X2]EPR44147.1 hypothetical protein dsx2_1891 [Desulfovibrio sp. X2]